MFTNSNFFIRHEISRISARHLKGYFSVVNFSASTRRTSFKFGRWIDMTETSMTICFSFLSNQNFPRYNQFKMSIGVKIKSSFTEINISLCWIIGPSWDLEGTLIFEHSTNVPSYEKIRLISPPYM